VIGSQRYAVRVMTHSFGTSIIRNSIVERFLFHKIANLSHHRGLLTDVIRCFVRMNNIINHFKVPHGNGRTIFIPIAAMRCDLALL
jgi:hypothetical protein